MTEGFKVIGIAVPTTNQNNEAQQDLGALWGRFYSENIFNKIPNKISNKILSIYTDYTSDYTGEYTAIIGVRVADLDVIPEGLMGREFPAQNFKKFVAKGSMPQAVMTTWSEIWQQDQELQRAYTYDVEVYDENAQKGDNSEVDIYISVK